MINSISACTIASTYACRQRCILIPFPTIIFNVLISFHVGFYEVHLIEQTKLIIAIMFKTVDRFYVEV